MSDIKFCIATVRPLKQNVTLLYYIPQELRDTVTIGTFVTVPIKLREVIAIVTELHDSLPSSKFQLRNITSVIQELTDVRYFPFLQILARYYQIKKESFFVHAWNFLVTKKKNNAILRDNNAHIKCSIAILTAEQKQIVDKILPNIIESQHTVSLIHGVTGSGKTECYKALIRETMALDKIVLLLLPEVALAQAFEYRLKLEMPDIIIHGFHSANSKNDRNLLFEALQKNYPMLIIGVHLPIMLPMAKLGLIIVDEEHDAGYQEKTHPKMNTKEIALIRGQQYNIPVILGSATPSINTLYNVEHKSWRLYTLNRRFSGSFPYVEKVSLLTKDKRLSFWISKRLEEEIRIRLEKKEQTLIFLNRRGMHFFVQCSCCSFVFMCNACAVSLTLHEKNMLHCHYCARTTILGKQCPQCSKSEKNFIKKGIGTQQIVTILTSLFPNARIARFDSDIRKKRGATEDILDNMKREVIDILVGTQAIARGFHFERVSLVGIIWADLHFHRPVYNAVEHAMQQLIQIAGRAGRSNFTSDNRVIVQTISDQVAFSFLSEQQYIALYKQECIQRKQFLYPPYVRLAEIELKNEDEAALNLDAQHMVTLLQKYIAERKLDTHILGPTKPPIPKIDNVYYQKLYLKSAQMSDIIYLYESMSRHAFTTRHFFVPNVITL